MSAASFDTAAGPASWKQTLESMPYLPITLIAVAGHMMLFGMLTPVMALYAQSFAVPDWQIGLMITVFAAGRLAADLPAGHATTRIGFRPLLGFGMLLCSVGALMGALAPDYVILLVGRALQGIGSGLFITAAMIYLAKRSDYRSRGKVMSLFQGATLIGGAFGPSVGGLSAAFFGLSGPFYVAAVIGLISGLLPLMLFKEVENKQIAAHPPTGSMFRLMLILPFLCVLLANFGFFLTRTAGQWQMIPLLADQRYAIGPDQLGFAMSMSAVANLAALPVAAWLVDRAPRAAIITFSLLATAAALVGIALAPDPTMLLVGLVAIGLATGIGGPAIGAYAVDVTPPGQQGMTMGVLRFAGDFGYLVGPLAIGVVVGASHIGYDGGLLLNAALLVSFAAVFILAGRELLFKRPHALSHPNQTRRTTMTERIWDKYLEEEDKAVFAASGFGALAEWGKRPALLIIDVNYAFCDEKPTPILESIKKWRTSCGEYAWEAMPVLQTLIETCRGKGIPIIYTTGTQRPDKWDAGSWAWKSSRRKQEAAAAAPLLTSDGLDGNEIVAEIAPGPRDIVIHKQKPSGFAGTPLTSYLQLLGCDSVIVTGTTTSGCVRATVLDAFSLNYRVTVVEDGCFDRAQANHAINLCDMHAKYANVLPSQEVVAHLNTLSQGMYDLPSGSGMSQVAAE
ncbi:MFS transporter [Pelagibacterium limicola]|uniref:MFS transporter n=1 Tax=Pelagibacterium limicola TaxID=2791022 RepID=UPI0018AFB21E|nr:MFS transporter [Pelagibacterium limicola]